MANRRVAGGRALAPSSRLNLYQPNWPRAMSRGEIERVARSFGEAVTLAREAGFDAVEVHAGHGYLLSQFLSPYTNRRTDEFGGSLENRMRFLRMAMSEVRRAAKSDVAVLVKTNLRDGFKGGIDIEEGVAVAKALEEMGADALVLSGGFVSRAPMYILRGAMPTRLLGHLMNNPLIGAGVKAVGHWLVPPVPYQENYFLEDACLVRAEVKSPLVYVGGAASRAAIDEVLSRGFDGVAMARALLVEPDFVRRLAEEEAARSACDHCNYCSARIYTTTMDCHKVNAPPPELLRLMAGHPGFSPSAGVK